MFSIPGLCALLFVIFVRPQEVVTELQRIPLIQMCFGLALFGLIIDIRIGRLRAQLAPQVPWAVAMLVWMMVTVAATAPERTIPALNELLILIGFFLVIAQGVQSFRALSVLAMTLVLLAMALAAIAVHQGVSPLGCAALDLSNPRDLSIGIPDGRPCQATLDCRTGAGAEPGAIYICERIGLLGTTSIGDGRVRYRGILQDPNELAMAISAALAFGFAFLARRRTMTRRLLLLAATVLVIVCLVMTKSRSGQLVFLTVVGTYALRRLGRRGLIVAAIVALPVLLIGGRGGAEADESSELRMVAWREGLSMLAQHPLVGVGQDHFTLFHGYTAHNSYVLAAAELGVPGFLLWTIVLYLSIKIPLVGARRYAHVAGAEVARDWGVALLAAMSGLAIGIVFLSMTYHALLWIYMAMAGAYYSAAAAHDPGWRVRFGWRDLALVIVLDTLLLGGTAVYLAVHGG